MNDQAKSGGMYQGKGNSLDFLFSFSIGSAEILSHLLNFIMEGDGFRVKNMPNPIRLKTSQWQY